MYTDGDGNGAQSQQPAGSAGPSAPGPALQEQIDKMVRQRLEQAFNGVFGKLLQTTERAASLAESQAAAAKADNIMKAVKVETWRPQTRDEELRTWREWWFQFSTWIIANDQAYEQDFAEIDPDKTVEHAFLPDAQVARSQKLFGLLCGLLKGRPLLLIRGAEASKNGLEAIRILRGAMEPREKARSLAMMRHLAAWTFHGGKGTMYEQLVRYEDALKAYELAAGRPFPEELSVATVVTGLKEPLRSQIQMRVGPSTKYSEIRDWVVQFENINTPWASSLTYAGGREGADQGGAQPMDVDIVKGKNNKGKDGKNSKGKDGKNSRGKDGKNTKGKDTKGKNNKGHGKGWQDTGWNSWNQSTQNPKGGKGSGKNGKGKGNNNLCHLCGQPGHWKNECPLKGGKGVHQIEAGGSPLPTVTSGAASSAYAPSYAPSSSASTRAGTVNRVQVFECHTPPTCSQTQIFDISEVEIPEDFALPEVLMVKASAVLEFPTSALVKGDAVPEYAMDTTDLDGDWTFPDGVPELDLTRADGVLAGVMAVRSGALGSDCRGVEVVVDSGADVSVAPLEFARLGTAAEEMGITMQDAQGRKIPQLGTRLLKLEVESTDGNMVAIRESSAWPASVPLFSHLGGFCVVAGPWATMMMGHTWSRLAGCCQSR